MVYEHTFKSFRDLSRWEMLLLLFQCISNKQFTPFQELGLRQIGAAFFSLLFETMDAIPFLV